MIDTPLPDCYFKADSLDDLLNDVFTALLQLEFIHSSRRSEIEGKYSEIFGATVELTNPRLRLSKSDTKGKLFSAIAELLWYFSGNDKLDFIQYYIDGYKRESYDGKTVYGGYGPRLFNSACKYNQVKNVINLLKEHNSSKRAVIQLFESRDIVPNKKWNVPSIPCTCTLQFMIRNQKLNMISFMRSNDAYRGLPHDIFAFTMLQEFIASAIGIDIGIYKHCVGSLHLYQNNEKEARQYIEEGFQSTRNPMPNMPAGSQQRDIRKLLKLESRIRKSRRYNIDNCGLNPFWKDIAYLLEIFKHIKSKNNGNDIDKIKSKLSTTIYDPYIEQRTMSITSNLH